MVNIATAPRQSLREAWDSLHPDEPRPASDLHVASGVVIKKVEGWYKRKRALMYPTRNIGEGAPYCISPGT